MYDNITTFFGAVFIAMCVRRLWRAYLAVRRPEEYRDLMLAKEEKRQTPKSGRDDRISTGAEVHG